MKYLNKFIDRGGSHNVYAIDKNFVLKMPIGTNKKSLYEFEEHINFMKSYPNIFANVKKLDKYRASVEKVNIKKAEMEIYHLHIIIISYLEDTPSLYNEYQDKYPDYIFLINLLFGFIDILDDKLSKNLVKKLRDILFNSKELIIKRWLVFYNLLKNEMPEIKSLDLNTSNFGIDRKGNIKLVDF